MVPVNILFFILGAARAYATITPIIITVRAISTTPTTPPQQLLLCSFIGIS